MGDWSWILWLILLVAVFIIIWFFASSNNQHITITEEEIKQTLSRCRSRKETICCLSLEKIYGKQFKTVRPSFLRNPETGRCLEIDCYNEELRLGAEFNGYQHYTWPNIFHKTKEEFLQQVRRDQFKAKRCEEEKVYLIIIPNTIGESLIPQYIWERLPETSIK